MTEAIHVVCPHCESINRMPHNRLAESPSCGKCHRKLFVGMPHALDTARFTRHIQNNDIPLLIDFWAPWCAPCRMMAPAFEQAAQRLEPKVRLVKVNTEEQQMLSAQFAIRSIPTLMLMHKGRELARQPGAMDAGAIINWVQHQLG